MASTIKIKNSSTAGAIPTSSDLVQGELAVNVTDKTIFTENASGTVVELGKNYTGFKNRIINGAMMIDQRNAGASVTPTNGQYTVDRWQAFVSQSSKITIQQNAGSVTPPAGFKSYLGVTVGASANVTVGSGDYFFIQQAIEGYNTADFGFGAAGASTITFSFWVRSSVTGTYGGVLYNGGGSRSYPYSYVINSANTWEQKTVTVTGDTTGTWQTATSAGLQLTFSLGIGSTYNGTAGAWAGANYYGTIGAATPITTNSATFYITGVQLEKGSTATSFDYRPYGTELQLCQRYYYKIKADAANRMLTLYGQCYSTAGCLVTAQFPTTMRTRPTALEQSGTAGDYKVFQANTSSSTCTVVPTFNSSTTEAAALIEGTVASGLVAGNATTMVSVNSSAYLAWSAEL